MDKLIKKSAFLFVFILSNIEIIFSQEKPLKTEDQNEDFWSNAPEIGIIIVFSLTIIITGILIYNSIYKRKKDAKRILNEKNQGNLKNEKLITNFSDDFFPSPREISYSAEPMPEEGFHLKLNYQFLIERLTRKLYLTFIFIILYSSTVAFILYKTSISERIAPDTTVMNEYEGMIEKIAETEKKIEEAQSEGTEDSNEITVQGVKMGSNENNIVSNISVKDFIKLRTVEYEDELINDVSGQFFQVYFLRYIFVRLFIASVLFTILGYLIRVYFRIRSDRNDLILKEEALSTLFYVVDTMEGYSGVDRDGKPKKATERYTTLKGKIPDFPLDKLFESSGYSKKGKLNSEVMNSFSNMINTVNSTNGQMLKILEMITPLLKKEK